MNIRTFRAPSMREALAQVRHDLGSEAIILSTRQVKLRRRFPWQRVRQEAEVVAGMAAQSAPLRANAELFAAHGIVAPRPTTSPAAAPPPTTHRTIDHFEPHPARRSNFQSPRTTLPPPSPPPPPSPSPPRIEVSTPPAVPTHNADLARDEAIHNLMQQLHVGIARENRRDVPDELFHLFTQLIDAEVADEDARDLVLELQQQGVSDILHDPLRVAPLLTSLIERDVQCAGPIAVTPGKRTVAALVGPTGVGKTTTVAKLAANFKLRDRVKVGLVTVDTYRVAAVEQLRTYAEIIDLPMHVVTSPREMRRAVHELGDMDLVLIDTAGRSPRDELKIQELKSLLSEADVDQVHLVLSLVSSIRALQNTAEKFQSVGTTSLLLTKLDEAPGMGAILSAARRIPLPISYITTGQDVPDDIESASAARTARLILGQDNPFGGPPTR